MNDYLLEILLRERRQEMLAQAQQQHLLKIYDRWRADGRRRFLALLGKQLIRSGEKLVARYGGATEGSPCCAEQVRPLTRELL